MVKLDKDIEDNNNNINIFTNLNKEDKIEYTNKDNVINFINSKLNTELVEESIIDIQVYNNKDNSSEELKSKKYFINIDNQMSEINILKNKLKLKDTYILHFSVFGLQTVLIKQSAVHIYYFKLMFLIK